jgi:hypothetical protein
MGAYASRDAAAFREWYTLDDCGKPRITIPSRLGYGGIRTTNFVGRPARPEPVTGEIQGRQLVQYDFTPEQYRALVRLTATLCKTFPKIRCDYPRDAQGRLVPRKLPDDELQQYEGILGHFHIQTNKVDPGPAFQWDAVINGARNLMDSPSPKGGAARLLSRQ